jgi:hypothetical protein
MEPDLTGNVHPDVPNYNQVSRSVSAGFNVVSYPSIVPGSTFGRNNRKIVFGLLDVDKKSAQTVKGDVFRL